MSAGLVMSGIARRWGRSLDFRISIFCAPHESMVLSDGGGGKEEKLKAENGKAHAMVFAVRRDLTDRLTYFCALHPSVQDQTAPAFAGRGDAQGGHRVAVREDSRGFQPTEPDAPRYSVLRNHTGTASPTSDRSSSPRCSCVAMRHIGENGHHIPVG